jgi:hypothetical protein
VPKPFTQAQMDRLYDNSMELMTEVDISKRGFRKLVKLIESAHNIQKEA